MSLINRTHIDYAERTINLIAAAGVVTGVAYNFYTNGPVIKATEWVFDALGHLGHTFLPSDSPIRTYVLPVFNAARVYQIYSLGDNATIDPMIGKPDSWLHIGNLGLAVIKHLQSQAAHAKAT